MVPSGTLMLAASSSYVVPSKNAARIALAWRASNSARQRDRRWCCCAISTRSTAAGAGSLTAFSGTQVAFTVGALTAQTAPGATLTASGAPSGVMTTATATGVLTASTAAAGVGGEYGPAYSATYGPQEGALTASDTRTGGPG